MTAGRSTTRGQALIEFALVLPLLFLLIFNLVNFGTFIYAWITVANAARTGAQYMIMGGAWVGIQPTAEQSAVIALATDDARWLPNTATLLWVQVCTKNGAAAAVCTVTVPPPSPPPAAWVTLVAIDPEPDNYVVGWVDVNYNYQPLISFWHLTLPPTTIHRRAVMRMVQ